MPSLYYKAKKYIYPYSLNANKRLAAKINNLNLTYLPVESLFQLLKKIKQIEEAAIPGIIVEAGCALGGSSIGITKVKQTDRALQIYDVFEQIPPPTNKDEKDSWDRYKVIASGQSKGLGDEIYYGYHDNLIHTIKQNFTKLGLDYSKEGVTFHKGLFEETMKIEDQVALAHIDCDWYQSVKTCLERITPQIVVNGIVIIDDYFTYQGCKKATDEYFADKKDQFTFENIAGVMHITKLK